MYLVEMSGIWSISGRLLGFWLSRGVLWKVVFMIHVQFCVGSGSDEFTVEVRHGGFFVGHGQLRSYVDGKVSWFDYCESETWSPLWFDDFIEQLGYERTESMRIYWQLPGKDVADGLRVISNDSDTNVMVSVVDRVKNLVVYFDHDDNIAGLDFDDIVVNPVAELPKVLSPHKVQYVPKKVDEKLPNFYSDVPSTSRGMVDDEGSDSSGGDDGSSEDLDFVDSDYEIDADDDDLFVKNVDVGVNDEGAAVNASSSQGAADDICIDEDCLDLPNFEDEGEVRLRFKSWSAEEFSNPVFKPGMVFPSVEVLRKAIT